MTLITTINDVIKVEYDKDTMTIYSNVNFRSAILDFNCISVYLFNGNRRIIATDQMKNKSVNDALLLCRKWVLDGIYDESDFAA